MSHLTLRYSCETKYAKVFTGSKKVKDRAAADAKVSSLLAINIREGYQKYTGFKLYDENNKIIEGF